MICYIIYNIFLMLYNIWYIFSQRYDAQSNKWLLVTSMATRRSSVSDNRKCESGLSSPPQSLTIHLNSKVGACVLNCLHLERSLSVVKTIAWTTCQLGHLEQHVNCQLGHLEQHVNCQLGHLEQHVNWQVDTWNNVSTWTSWTTCRMTTWIRGTTCQLRTMSNDNCLRLDRSLSTAS